MIDLRRNTDQSAEVFTGSLNDIMFFLMLFFIIASTLLNPSMIKVTLPNSQNSQSIHQKEIHLTITKDLRYYVNNTEVQYANLEAQLKSELDQNPGAFVILRMDNVLTVQKLVDILSLGNKLNTKMTIATAKTAQ
ncbi:MAG: biopolymer transporter ExbD [Bacteroidales bacterium]|nr:biopolymer transporter ExbD [Bacteroidales bacterium]